MGLGVFNIENYSPVIIEETLGTTKGDDDVTMNNMMSRNLVEMGNKAVCSEVVTTIMTTKRLVRRRRVR